jgi:DNA-binding response OmpR family regulator
VTNFLSLFTLNLRINPPLWVIIKVSKKPGEIRRTQRLSFSKFPNCLAFWFPNSVWEPESEATANLSSNQLFNKFTMKNILLICDHTHIDVPLRRSLAHLVNSCYIEIIPRGHRALDVLKTKTFDLIIVDSTLVDIDCLELVESIEYMDPGLPVILMLRQEHRPLWGPARSAGANPILRPFKPLAFLRLIDNLLHEQLERYRELAKTLELALATLSSQIQASLVFLVDGAGAILLSTAQAERTLLSSLPSSVGAVPTVGTPATQAGRTSGPALHEPLLESLARLVVTRFSGQGELEPEDEMLLAPQTAEADQELYGLAITENLYMAILLPPGLVQPLIPTWLQLEVTGYAIKEAFIEYEIMGATSADQALLDATAEAAPLDRLIIPLKLASELNPAPLAPAPEPAESEEENLQVNWQIISNNSAILNRLQDFCQLS